MNLVFIKVIPNSSENKIAGKFIDEKGQKWLKINIASVAENGKANKELIKFLSIFFKIPKSEIEIIRGETSRLKVVRINSDISKIDKYA